jgi:hypothetical protein
VEKSHVAARLKQEAPQEENAQDDDKRDNYYLDETHSRYLTVKRLRLIREGILSAQRTVCQRLSRFA